MKEPLTPKANQERLSELKKEGTFWDISTGTVRDIVMDGRTRVVKNLCPAAPLQPRAVSRLHCRLRIRLQQRHPPKSRCFDGQ